MSATRSKKKTMAEASVPVTAPLVSMSDLRRPPIRPDEAGVPGHNHFIYIS